MSVQEVVVLLGVIFTPVGGGFGALFFWVKAQAADRIKDKDAEIARQQSDHQKEMERLQADHQREIVRLVDDRERAYRERDRFIDLAVEGAETTRVAQDTAQRVTAVVERTRGPR